MKINKSFYGKNFRKFLVVINVMCILSFIDALQSVLSQKLSISFFVFYFAFMCSFIPSSRLITLLTFAVGGCPKISTSLTLMEAVFLDEKKMLVNTKTDSFEADLRVEQFSLKLVSCVVLVLTLLFFALV